MSNNLQISSMIPDGVRSVVIIGHIHPDGDCVGTCLGLYHYLKENMPELETEICLQKFDASFFLLKDADRIQMMEEMDMSREFDLCISCDASDRKRLGDADRLFEQAAHTICIDHHITNTGFADANYIRGGYSSAAETLGELLDMNKVSKNCAECLFLGVSHDTGIFRFSNTTLDTMIFAGKLLEKGIDQTSIIDKTYYARTIVQTRICGYAMEHVQLYANGKISAVVLHLTDLQRFGADSGDLDGIVDQLRIIEGVEAAVFLYEQKKDHYKVSMRSNNHVDVSRVAVLHGGGGHVKAAGFDQSMSADILLSMVLSELQAQL